MLVGNCFGFVGNRMVESYGRESAYMVEEGASVEQIDKALFDFGMPMGPFAMADLAGNGKSCFFCRLKISIFVFCVHRGGCICNTDITQKIRKSLGLLDPKTRPKNERYHGGLGDKLCEMGRLGMKTGEGWYVYKKGARRGASDPAVHSLIAQHRQEIGVTQRSFTDEEIVQRCIYPMINEGFKILEEGIEFGTM